MGSVDVRIGVTYSAREIELQLGDDTDHGELHEMIDGVLGGDGAVLWITDKRGREVGIPSDKVTYVEIGSDSEGRAIGFSS